MRFMGGLIVVDVVSTTTTGPSTISTGLSGLISGMVSIFHLHWTFMRSDTALLAKFQSHAKSHKFEASYIRLHADKRKVIATGPKH